MAIIPSLFPIIYCNNSRFVHVHGPLSLCHGMLTPRGLGQSNASQVVPVMPTALVSRAGVEFKDRMYFTKLQTLQADSFYYRRILEQCSSIRRRDLRAPLQPRLRLLPGPVGNATTAIPLRPRSSVYINCDICSGTLDYLVHSREGTSRSSHGLGDGGRSCNCHRFRGQATSRPDDWIRGRRDDSRFYVGATLRWCRLRAGRIQRGIWHGLWDHHSGSRITARRDREKSCDAVDIDARWRERAS